MSLIVRIRGRAVRLMVLSSLGCGSGSMHQTSDFSHDDAASESADDAGASGMDAAPSVRDAAASPADAASTEHDAGQEPGKDASVQPILTDDWPALSQLLGNVRGVADAPISKVDGAKYTPGMLLGNGDLGVVVGGSDA